MKRILSFFLCVVLAVGSCSLSGCKSQKKKTVVNMTGKEIAKMLLANTRLDSSDLSLGLEDALTTENSLVEARDVVSVMSSENQAVLLSTSTSGNTVTWRDFSNECNTYDFFSSYFKGIEDTADKFADLIDTVKESCKNTEYWIKISSDKVLLRVEANQETIFVKTDVGYQVCRRYTNEDADDVYEMYSKVEDGSYTYEERMLYIAGKRYEFSSGYGGYEGLYIVAENTRGYWNMFQVSDIEKNRCNIMNFVSTGSMAFTFDNSMAPGMPQVDEYAISFSTSDLSNDIVTMSPGSIDMNLSAFNGVDRVEANAANVTGSEGSNALVIGEGILVTSSGKRLDTANRDQEGTTIGNIQASFTMNFYGEGNHRTSGRVQVRVDGNTCFEQMENFKAFLKENGMSCKYNLDSIASKYNTAQELAKNFKNVYKWNGYSVNNYSGIEKAVKIEKDLYKEFAAMYDGVKDIKTVESTSFGESFEGWDFSKVGSVQCGNVTLSDDKITVNNMSVVVNDTAIFDANEKYTVCLALTKFKDDTEADYENAVIMQCEGADVTSFDGGNTITLNQTATFTLPRCAAEGKYTVVAYVATDDGIRVSEMVPVIFSEDIEKSENYDGFKIDYKVNESKEIRIECTINVDVYIKPEDVQTEYTYEQMYELLKQGVLSYGYFVEGASVESYDSSTGTATMIIEGTTLTGGIYRMEYVKQLEGSEVKGYVYFEF